MGKYVCNNGTLCLSDTPVIAVNNRAFNYGDGVFETIRCLSSEPLFFDKHYARLVNSLAILSIELPSEYSENYFRFHINRLLQKNRIYKGARVRLTVFRESGGFYSPKTNKACFVITAGELPEEKYTLNTKGLNAGIFKENKKPVNKLSGIKSCNSLFFVLAGLWRQQQELDDCFIVNDKGRIVEGLSSNVFLVKNNVLFTPSISSGCVTGTMRRTVMELAENQGVSTKEVDGFTEGNLKIADEVFFTNAIQGIRFVAGIEDRRYYHKMASFLVNELNSKI